MNMVLYPLNDVGGGTPTHPMKTVAVVDKDRDGLAGFGLSDSAPWSQDAPTDTFLFDSDDWIIEGLAKEPGGSDFVFKNWADSQETGQLGVNEYLESDLYKFALDFDGDNPLAGPDYVDAGDPVFLFWWPCRRASDATPGPDAPFGVVNVGGLPAAGQSVGYNDLAVSSPDAVYSTAPEPATLALLLVGGGLAALRRRRHA